MGPASSREDRGERKEGFTGIGSWKSVTMFWEGRVGPGGETPLQKGKIKVRKPWKTLAGVFYFLRPSAYPPSKP